MKRTEDWKRKGKRLTEEQINRVLKEADSGLKVTDLCRQQGISETTYYRWKSKHGGMDVSEAKRLRDLEEENRRLKQLVADKGLYQMHPQRHWPGIGPASLPSVGIVEEDPRFQPGPGRQGIQPLQKLLRAGLVPLVLVVQVGKAGLIEHGLSSWQPLG